MIGRRVPPVHSPVTLGALSAGWASALGFGGGTALADLTLALRKRFAADAAILTDSGTSALALALTAALRGRPAAPVALPAYACYDIATAAAAANVPVVLYDVDPLTLGPDWASFERALAAGAGAVVIAYLYGYPIDWNRATALCVARGAVIIEDAAQGSGGSWNGAPLGSHGPLSVLSFGRGKGVTGGAGGAVLARGSGARLLEVAPGTLGPAASTVRALTALAAQYLFARPSLYAIPSSLPFLRLGETVYREPHEPRAFPPGLAPIVLDALELVEHEAGVRHARAALYERAAAGAGLPAVALLPGSRPGYLRFPLRLRRAPGPEAATLGIVPAYPRPLSDLPQLAARVTNPGEPCPGAAALASDLYTLPTHSRLADRDVRRIEGWLGSRG